MDSLFQQSDHARMERFSPLSTAIPPSTKKYPMGAPNDKIVPEIVNVYESPFYLAMRKHGAAFLDEKLHPNGVLPKDVTFFAPCQVGRVKSQHNFLGDNHPDKKQMQKTYESLGSTHWIAVWDKDGIQSREIQNKHYENSKTKNFKNDNGDTEEEL
jgi:hypothetical protein